MKSMSSAMRVLTVVLGISIAGCATSFSPERVRGEIAAQTGQDHDTSSRSSSAV